MEKVFSIIVTYNGEKWIEKCLESLSRSTYSTEIVVVDNGSSDGTLKILNDRYKDVVLIKPSENIGFGRANNLGMKYALEHEADFVFLINQDVFVHEDALALLVKCAIMNNTFGILSPVHLDGSGTALDFGFSNCIAPTHCKGLMSDIFLGKAKNLYECDFINGAAWLMSRECLKVVGGFNPIFFMYGEDNELIYRLRYHNLKIGIVTESIIFHDRGERKLDMTESYYVKKYENWSKMLLLNLNVPFSVAYLRFIKGIVLSLKFCGLFSTAKIFYKTNYKIFKIIKSRSFAGSNQEFKWIMNSDVNEKAYE